ncbi:GSCFA domain-containing protein [Flavobacterium microcysteis]
MQFATPIPIPKSHHPIGYGSKTVSLGSCFAENMGNKLDYFKFQNITNPFGILFHPLALNKIMQKAICQEQFTEEDIFFHNERWHSFDVHSELSHSDKTAFLKNLNLNLGFLHKALRESNHVIITLGTSWVYRKIETDAIVANCHKVPQAAFKKELLSIQQIKESLLEIIATVLSFNPKANLIFTVSPVRHIKDGFVENQWSKSNLISGLHEAIHSLEGTHYFPSYEIMMDELRDYRFYAEDMIHPSSLAIDYIWKRFAETWISEDAFSIMQEVDSIRKGLSHRSFNPESEQHQKFLENLQNKMLVLQAKYPFMEF